MYNVQSHVHCTCDCTEYNSPSSVLKCPAEQSVHSEDPSSEKEPAEQDLHSEDPRIGEMVPPGHALQEVDPGIYVSK